MGDSAGAAFPSEGVGAGAQDPKMEKGKEKATEPAQEEDVSMGEDDDEDSSDESVGDDNPEEEDDETGDDNLEPISTDNIINGGRRTRGKAIDYANVAKESDEEMDDDDDEDFRAPTEGDQMQG